MGKENFKVIESYDEAAATLIDHTRSIANLFEADEIAGHFVIAWNEAGEFSVGSRCHKGPGPRLAAALIKEVASELREEEHIRSLLSELE